MKTKTILIIALFAMLSGLALGIGFAFLNSYDFKVPTLIFETGKTNYVWQEKYTITKSDIDVFLEIYENDFEPSQIEIIKNEFQKYAKNGAIEGKNIETFLKNASYPDFQQIDKFKTLLFSSRFTGRLPYSGVFNFKKQNDKEKIKNDLKEFDKYYAKISYQQDCTRRGLFEKLKKEIKEGNIQIRGKFDDSIADKLFSLSTVELDLLANKKTKQLTYKIITGSPDSESAIKNLGLDENLAHEMRANQNAYRLLMEQFLSVAQYKALGNVQKQNTDNIAQKLEAILTPEQKEELAREGADIQHLALQTIKVGFYTPYNWRYIEKNWGDSTGRITGELSLDGKTQKQLKDVVFATPYLPDNTTDKIFKNALSKTVFADISQEHNQIADVINKIIKDCGRLPSTVINFDSHSDMYGVHAFQDGTVFIADWVNWALAQEGVKRFIWVIPKESMENNPDAPFVYFDYHPYTTATISGNMDYTQISCYSGAKPYRQKIWVDCNDFKIMPALDLKKPEGNVKIVDFIMATEESLPDLKNILQDEDVLLSLDGDYFNCSGYNTQAYISTLPFDIAKTFARFARALDKSNLKPKFLSMTISVRYTGYERNDELYGFYKYLLKTAGLKDTIQKYVGKIGQQYDTDRDYTEISVF